MSTDQWFREFEREEAKRQDRLDEIRGRIESQPKPMTHLEIEALLSAGKISVLMSNGNYWRVRKNGQTKLWKTRPQDFYIPIKFGIRGYGKITNHSQIGTDKTLKPDFLLEL